MRHASCSTMTEKVWDISSLSVTATCGKIKKLNTFWKSLPKLQPEMERGYLDIITLSYHYVFLYILLVCEKFIHLKNNLNLIFLPTSPQFLDSRSDMIPHHR